MKLIVGLGNPGSEYDKTRHNAGFRVIDALAARHRIAIDTHEKDALTGRGRLAGQTVMVARPLTYMNLSGVAVSKLVRKYLDHPGELMVVYDDVDLDLGTIRIREKGSPGTHNGMRSLREHLQTDQFARLRFGVRGEGFARARDLADYVLEDFTADEEVVVSETIDRCVDALLLFARGDLSRAMNQFNRVSREEVSP